MIPLQTQRELACFHCTPGKCGRQHGGECGCECHVPATDDVVGSAAPAPREPLSGGPERGPANTPVEIKTRKELRENFGSIHSPGSIGALEESVHILLEEEAPMGVAVDRIKRELARYWLGRPRGVLARLRWAAKLLLEP